MLWSLTTGVVRRFPKNTGDKDKDTVILIPPRLCVRVWKYYQAFWRSDTFILEAIGLSLGGVTSYPGMFSMVFIIYTRWV